MTPILGILASGMSGNLWAPGKDYDSIATTTVGAGGAASITFSSIPQTYRHLQIRGIMRTDRAGQPKDQLRMQLNSDTGSNYVAHYLSGDGASAAAAANTGLSFINNNSVTGATSAASIFGVVVMDILDYTNTNKYTTVRFLSGYDTNGAGTVELDSGLWLNTAAITNINIAAIANLVQYTQLALYGVK
jgi:hypothetical protein